MNESLDRTQEMLPRRVPTQPQSQQEFRKGVAQVSPPPPTTLRMRPELPTGQIVTSGHLKQPKLPLRHRLRNLRTGGRFSLLGAAVLLVCWMLWAAQSPRGSLANEALILVLIVAVAVGLFGVSRLVGGIFLERMLKRTRRSARLSHLVIGVFLTLAGVSLLPQVEWLINAWNEVRGMR
ncbi:MAG TPA: hypothetical protein VFC19_47230 [Candidatus Limnocylindrales bacterium]|nr:hypothetical protein [Candidatus Limnocylindrales bacterium]